MNNSAIPSRLTVVFSVGGDKNTIPVNSTSETLANGLAAMDSGFPPLTRKALSAGGKPPRGEDFNGIYNDIYTRLQWGSAGMGFPFSADFSEAIAGYPKGALIPNSDYTGQWLNLNNGNRSSPESTSGANTGWVPVGGYGISTISSLSNSSVTLSSAQASKDRLILTGSLTGNINMIFPAWMKSWTIENRCSGNFSVTCKTASGIGIAVPAGRVEKLYCDGVSILRDFGTAAMRNIGTATSRDVPDMSNFPRDDNPESGYFYLPNGHLSQYGTVNLPAVGTFNPASFGGVTYYTRYYIVDFPVAYPNAQISTVVSLAGKPFDSQSNEFGSWANSNRTLNSGQPVSKNQFVVSVTSNNPNLVPVIHYKSEGY